MRISFIVVIATLVVIGGFFFSHRSQNNETASSPASVETAAAGRMSGLPSVDARTIEAMRAIFPNADPNTGVLTQSIPSYVFGDQAYGERIRRVEPLFLVGNESAPVLIVKAETDEAAHAEAGALAAIYLTRDSDRLIVSKPAVFFGAGEWGQAAAAEIIDVQGEPAILARAVGGGMGCFMESAEIYAFPSQGPRQILEREFVSLKDEGLYTVGDEVVGAVVRPPSGFDFALRFTGQFLGDRIDETVLYRMQGGRLIRVQGANPLADGC